MRIRIIGRRGVLNATLTAFNAQIQLVGSNTEPLTASTLILFQIADPLSVVKFFNNLKYNTEYKFRFQVSDTNTKSDYSPWTIFKTKDFRECK